MRHAQKQGREVLSTFMNDRKSRKIPRCKTALTFETRARAQIMLVPHCACVSYNSSGYLDTCKRFALTRLPSTRISGYLAIRIRVNAAFMSSFSFECKMDFRKLFVGSPGNEDSITKTAKVPQAVQAVFFFFFLPFSQFFCAKKLTHKQVRPRNVVVLISQSFVCTVSWHWPRPARSAFFHNNVTSQYTLHIVT